MHSLSLRSVSAYWYRGTSIGGHDSLRSVSLDTKPGEWLAVVGRNGVGKSSLLSAIAGTISFVRGRITVNAMGMPPRDLASRFQAGLQYIPQERHVQADYLSFADIVELACLKRRGLHNEHVIGTDLRIALASIGILGQENGEDVVRGRAIDLVMAIVAAPAVLLMDEMGATAGDFDHRRALYRTLKALLPITTVVFSEHDIENVLECADRVVWLRERHPPTLGNVADLTDELKAEFDTTREAERGDFGGLSTDLLRPDEGALSQLRLAIQASSTGLTTSSIESEIVTRFPFLKSGGTAEALSGGERVVLSWLIAMLAGLPRIAHAMKGHLHKAFLQGVNELNREIFGRS